VWDYAEAGRLATLDTAGATECIYCQASMLRLPAQRFEAEVGEVMLAQLALCRLCGWWNAYRVHQKYIARTAGLAEGYSGTIGSLKELDLTDISVPLSEVRQYLLARQDELYSVHPRVFEEVVCSVFKDLGWQARVTAYAGDDGIDVVLDGPDGATVGVQVKRYGAERKIEAEQIRSFAGALVLDGRTRGVFVTTSDFRKGAYRTAAKYAAIGYPIELVNASRFLEALGIAQVESFKLDGERLARYILSYSHHLGSGVHIEFVPGEDLTQRPIAIQTLTRDELLSRYAEESDQNDRCDHKPGSRSDVQAEE
jgi:restriction system protein